MKGRIDQRNVCVYEEAATGANALTGMHEETGGIHVFPLVICRREVTANVALGQCTINGVT